MHLQTKQFQHDVMTLGLVGMDLEKLSHITDKSGNRAHSELKASIVAIVNVRNYAVLIPCHSVTIVL
jgi:hypothetical protein